MVQMSSNIRITNFNVVIARLIYVPLCLICGAGCLGVGDGFAPILGLLLLAIGVYTVVSLSSFALWITLGSAIKVVTLVGRRIFEWDELTGMYVIAGGSEDARYPFIRFVFGDEIYKARVTEKEIKRVRDWLDNHMHFVKRSEISWCYR